MPTEGQAVRGGEDVRSGKEPGNLILGSANGVVGMEGNSGEDGAVGGSILLDAGHWHLLRRSLPDGVETAEIRGSEAGAVCSGGNGVQGLG